MIGCRDAWTLDLCRQKGLRGFLSGCVTLLLARPEVSPGDEVLLVDLPKEALDKLPSDLLSGAERLTHRTDAKDWQVRRHAAEELLRRYAAARVVITNRLHAVLPCAAFGTPVVLFRPAGADAAHRFAGYEHLAWSIDNAPWMQPRLPANVVRALAELTRPWLSEQVAALGATT